MELKLFIPTSLCIDGFVQDCGISIANAPETLQSHAETLILFYEDIYVKGRYFGRG